MARPLMEALAPKTALIHGMREAPPWSFALAEAAAPPPRPTGQGTRMRILVINPNTMPEMTAVSYTHLTLPTKA